MPKSDGLHHITAIAGEPKRHVAFYAGVLGLRLIKRTVNFDVPTTWHLYYGDELGAPGTALTFFVWEHLPKAQRGAGEAQEIVFAVPPGSLRFWEERLKQNGYAVSPLAPRFGEQGIGCTGPDGHRLEFVATDCPRQGPGWSNGEVPKEHTIRGFHGVTLEVDNPSRTATVLSEVFGYAAVGQEGPRTRLRAAGDGIASIVDLRASSGARSRQGIGSVHHIAFRANNDEDELAMRSRALELGLAATEPISRLYFRSVYFREPEGTLFEIATDGPGFTADEPKEELGRNLKLPPWHEPRRSEIEAALPALE